MKSSLSTFKRHEGVYKKEVFDAISELGFRFFPSATEYIVLWYNGKWEPYDYVREHVKGLPEIPYE